MMYAGIGLWPLEGSNISIGRSHTRPIGSHRPD